MQRLSTAFIMVSIFFSPAGFTADSHQNNDNIDLQTQFHDPPVIYRPLQIIHGFDGPLAAYYPGKRLDSSLVASLLASPTETENLHHNLTQAMQRLKDLGLGGVVCNVSFRDYLRDESQWQLWKMGLDTCRELGLRVWIYDEDGYPSGAAGGLVLERNAAFEAQELILDPAAENGYRIRPSYEGTHACNNYFMARRYPNLIDRRACRTFLEVTHEAYGQRCAEDLGKTIEAFFTDEPSLMACNLGPIPEEARKNVPIRDPLDPAVQRLPAVPWVDDLPGLFLQTYHYDIKTNIQSLFAGESENDRTIRRDFWMLISRLFADRYFGVIQTWCGNHQVASSGHILWEENILYHPALNGNPLRNLQRMDIPGIDVLSSHPANGFGGYAVTAALASSAALLNGTRRVMTETSDFSEQMGGRAATIEEMCATAAWQFAQGVTDFTLYYNSGDASRDYRAYCDCVGRLATLLTPARRVVRIALYYPIVDCWAWYLPSGERMSNESQPETLKSIVNSFSATCSQLVRAGHSFCLIDAEGLAKADVSDGKLAIEQATVDMLIVPVFDKIPESAQTTIERFQKAGGTVIHTHGKDDWLKNVPTDPFLQVISEQPGCMWAQYNRDELQILLMANMENKIWEGVVQTRSPNSPTRWNFTAGTVTALNKPDQNHLAVTLNPYECIALVW